MAETGIIEATKCSECGGEGAKPFQLRTRSKTNPLRRFDLCPTCRRLPRFARAYRVFSTERIPGLPALGFTTHKRTVGGKNYLLHVHSNDRTVVYGQNVSANTYGGGYIYSDEAQQVLLAVGPAGSYLDR